MHLSRIRPYGLPQVRLSRHEVDAVVSSLAMHHLRPGEKAILYPAIRGSLRPGGIFANYDLVREPTIAWEHFARGEWTKLLAACGWSTRQIAELFAEMETEDSPLTLAG